MVVALGEDEHRFRRTTAEQKRFTILGNKALDPGDVGSEDFETGGQRTLLLDRHRGPDPTGIDDLHDAGHTHHDERRNDQAHHDFEEREARFPLVGNGAHFAKPDGVDLEMPALTPPDLGGDAVKPVTARRL